jgi:predicted phage terminase large subunit-like protein
VYIYMEQEPGASGKALIDYYARHVLPGYPFWGVPSTGSKEHRAAPLSAAAERGHVVLVRGDWSISDFLDEAEAFPWGEHDDQIDAVSGAVQKLRELVAGAVTVPQAAQGTAYMLGVITGGRRLLRP